MILFDIKLISSLLAITTIFHHSITVTSLQEIKFYLDQLHHG